MKELIKNLQDANTAKQAAQTTLNDLNGSTDTQAVADAETAVKDASVVFDDCLNAILSLDLATAQ